MEITNEWIDSHLESPTELYGRALVRDILLALKEERAKPKVDVWKNAPEEYDIAYVAFASSKTGYEYGSKQEYIRTLPKTRVRLIAERKAGAYMTGGRDLADLIEAAILEAKSEWEAELKEEK